MNALLEPAKWDRRQRALHDLLLFAFRFLGQTKEQLADMAREPDLVDALKAFVHDCREDVEWLKAAVGFLESAEVRVMVAMAAACRQEKKAA